MREIRWALGRVELPPQVDDGSADGVGGAVILERLLVQLQVFCQ